MLLLKLVTLFLGAEFFCVRFLPGVGFTFALMASFIVNSWLFQHLPVTPGHAMLLQLATGLGMVYFVLGIAWRGSAWVRNEYVSSFHSGGHLLSCFGAMPVKAVLHTVEPLVCFVMAGFAIYSVTGRLGMVMPWWMQMGLAPDMEMPNPWDYLPVWFDSYVDWFALGYVAVAWLGFFCHARLCDWPETEAYYLEQRELYEAQAAARGQMTFSTVEEVGG